MLPIEITIRKAAKKDIPRIVELWKVLRDYHVRHLDYDDEIYRHRKNAVSLYGKHVTKKIRARNYAIFVAEADGKVVGHVIARIDKGPPIYVHDRKVYVDELVVEEAYRGKGVGKKLLKQAEEWGKKKGLSLFSLHVAIKNRNALSLYKKFGLKEHHITMNKKIK